MTEEKIKEYTDTVMPVTVKYTDYETCEYTEEQLQEAFDAGADSVTNELMKYLTEYPLPAIGVDKILAKLKEIKDGE